MTAVLRLRNIRERLRAAGKAEEAGDHERAACLIASAIDRLAETLGEIEEAHGFDVDEVRARRRELAGA